ncbi:MAG: hypothetical protein WAN65_10930 [Candidatus Sulfotelmatobacter sp.]
MNAAAAIRPVLVVLEGADDIEFVQRLSYDYTRTVLKLWTSRDCTRKAAFCLFPWAVGISAIGPHALPGWPAGNFTYITGNSRPRRSVANARWNWLKPDPNVEGF